MARLMRVAKPNNTLAFLVGCLGPCPYPCHFGICRASLLGHRRPCSAERQPGTARAQPALDACLVRPRPLLPCHAVLAARPAGQGAGWQQQDAPLCSPAFVDILDCPGEALWQIASYNRTSCGVLLHLQVVCLSAGEGCLAGRHIQPNNRHPAPAICWLTLPLLRWCCAGYSEK